MDGIDGFAGMEGVFTGLALNNQLAVGAPDFA